MAQFPTKEEISFCIACKVSESTLFYSYLLCLFKQQSQLKSLIWCSWTQEKSAIYLYHNMAAVNMWKILCQTVAFCAVLDLCNSFKMIRSQSYIAAKWVSKISTP